ncbi:MAG: hypothetical protein IPJ33_06385 [Gammaproteobacteria bacterium]|jgi:hypothetical protein|nr:hypothetical protein [Gammaproteobacteria bacterium]MBP6051102.1 hypothetical protein [Pseudomonadales bacterium]MBK6584206.1 hypothetical protein [Gammaproteobacteria bacterium]MBK7168542.1 hypothetical protein [Gammaproteobacteria bacterium]MBK7520390.1 hypothetical protein [Gammaproteobacteria bacterium]
MPKYLYFKPRAGLPESLRRASNEFHAVSVVCGKEACEGVRRLSQKRFLSKDAPQLPLSYCSSKSCNCRYVHFADRRGGEERREENNRRWGQLDSVLQRSKEDRRSARTGIPARPDALENQWFFLAK